MSIDYGNGSSLMKNIHDNHPHGLKSGRKQYIYRVLGKIVPVAISHHMIAMNLGFQMTPEMLQSPFCRDDPKAFVARHFHVMCPI
jgi:hypothetical protein